MRVFSISSRARISASSASRLRSARSRADLGLLLCLVDGDLALLCVAQELGLLLDVEKVLLRLQVLLPDPDGGVLLHVVAVPAAFLYLLGQARLAQRRLGLDGLLLEDPRLLDLLLRTDLRLLGFLVPSRPVPGDRGALLGAADGDLLLLGEAGVMALLVDVQGELLGLQVLVADLDEGVLLDVVAALLARLDLLGEPRQALGVEGVGGIEDADVGLVEAGQGDRLHLQAVMGQDVLDQLLDPAHVLAALLLHLVHAHARGHVAQGIDEAALDQLLQGLGVHGPPAERLRRRGHGVPVRADPQVELGHHLHPHAVPGDERRGAAAPHFDPLGLHAHQGDVVDDREDQCAAAQDHLLATEAGAHEGDLLRGALVEPVEQVDDDRDEDAGEQDCGDDVHSGHGSILPDPRALRSRPRCRCNAWAGSLLPPCRVGQRPAVVAPVRDHRVESLTAAR